MSKEVHVHAREAGRDFLRHVLATLAYRGGKAVRGVPPEATAFQAAPTSRSPLQILAHINDVLAWGLTLARGESRWTERAAGSWDDEAALFHVSLGTLDAFLAGDTPLACAPETLFQGPLADALTHVGQITLLRRVAGAPVRGENYFRADIAAGRLGPEQAAPRREFD